MCILLSINRVGARGRPRPFDISARGVEAPVWRATSPKHDDIAGSTRRRWLSIPHAAASAPTSTTNPAAQHRVSRAARRRGHGEHARSAQRYTIRF